MRFCWEWSWGAAESPSSGWLLVSILIPLSLNMCKRELYILRLFKIIFFNFVKLSSLVSTNPLLPPALRALRTLRFISFLKGLQVLVTALIQTFRSSVLYLLLLLLILMFLFAIMGYYFFGYDEQGDKKNWGSFGIAFLSLFTYVTVSGNGLCTCCLFTVIVFSRFSPLISWPDSHTHTHTHLDMRKKRKKTYRKHRHYCLILELYSFTHPMQADGWTTLQEQLSVHGFSGSEFFTIAFLFLGHFIFTNLFIGVIIMVSWPGERKVFAV